MIKYTPEVYVDGHTVIAKAHRPLLQRLFPKWYERRMADIAANDLNLYFPKWPVVPTKRFDAFVPRTFI